MQENPTRRESEILKQFLYIREEKRNSLFIGLVLRGKTEITKKIIFQFRGGKRNLNCFQNDNKTRLVKLSLSAIFVWPSVRIGSGTSLVSREEKGTWNFASREWERKFSIISLRDFHEIEPLDSVWVGHLYCEPPTGGITIITIVLAKVLLALVCSTVHSSLLSLLYILMNPDGKRLQLDWVGWSCCVQNASAHTWEKGLLWRRRLSGQHNWWKIWPTIGLKLPKLAKIWPKIA